MATAFRPVNVHSPIPEATTSDMTSPTTPRPAAPGSQLEQPRSQVDDATTPTRASFQASLSSQKPLPTSPFPQAVRVPNSASPSGANEREGSANDDVEMDGSSNGQAEAGSNGHDGDIPEEDESDEDSPNADGSRSSKKKKSQRFYCTDFPPCNLSFTRSEHLARHIRKHTGERPFQCHCSRRFSRLDNLRQHAQTVHINEDIPMDSLAATGSRYQRQIRTDRVRPTTGRARASTAGSMSGPVRGHSKSLSTSSIQSMSSVGSVFDARGDIRRRPAPLVMADHRTRLSSESYHSAADSAYSYRHPSPGEFSTPTSATYSTNQSSPRWSAMGSSPTSAHTHSRSQSMFTDSRMPPGRRLSVPSGANPFQGPHGAIVGHTVMVPPGVGPSSAGGFSPGTVVATPTSGWGSGRRDSISSSAAGDDGWRRRTWHPDSRNFAAPTSTLNSVANAESIHPNAPAPIAHGPPNPNNTVRLPGIESFITAPRPATPPKRAPSPMAVDTEMAGAQAPHPLDPESGRSDRQWEMGLHRGLTRLDISNTPPGDAAGTWASETERAVQAQAEQARVNQPTVRFQVETPPTHPAGSRRTPPRAYQHQHTLSAPSITTPRESKRHGWYHGPPNPHGYEQAQGDVNPDPRPRVERMVHPNVAAFSGFPAREPAQQQQQQQQNPQQPSPSNPEALKRLEALVAVAANEGKTATAY
ncbi:related to transcription factor RGM1 [Cephalotrichum gorgonifer]|uniref:Related to transcription factor RGM1 n=1 Tax=Cephalotrichum gorgonifer TaxID=2041049 RepID=A0AAE8N580_9PEZI|nr:related to transcription factor RGM1 [Cephalotrichum gorgonifer]